jgi:RHS repeat-associated protein
VTYGYNEPSGLELWSPYSMTSGTSRTVSAHDDLRRPTSSVTMPVSCTVNADCDDNVASNGSETCVANECVAGVPSVDMLGWDGMDRLMTVRPLGRGPHGLSYDDADRGDGYTPPVLAGQPSGELEAHRDLDGLVTRLDFHAEALRSIQAHRLSDGRLSSVQHEGHTLAFGYHPTTHALSSLTTNDGVALEITRDGPLLESVTWSGSAGVSGTVAFGYGDLWDVASVAAGGVTTNYHYDADGAIDCVAPDATATAACTSGLRIGPDVLGRSLELTYGSTSTEHEWSDLGEATATVHTWQAGQLSFTYEARDADGRLTRVVEEHESGTDTTEYAYDRVGRLAQVTRNGVVSETYSYDPNSQRLTATQDGVSVSPIVWDDRDRLLQYGAVTYTYDALGRRQTRTQSGQTTTYTYDLRGALRAVDLPGAASDIAYVIDGAGRRVGRKVGGVLQQTWLYVDELRPLVEMNGAGQVTRVFVYGASRVPELMIIPAGPDVGTYRIFTDHLGSVRRVVHAGTGATAQAMAYDAFGNVELDTNPGFQPFGYAGGLYDGSTSLVRFGARDYDPQIGQWTARDPILFAGGDDNLYNYVGASPVEATDPSGLWFTDTCRANPVVCGIAMRAASGAVAVMQTARNAVQRAATVAPTACRIADRALASAQQRLQNFASSAQGTGTVWDSVRATQPLHPGTQIPRSFELTTSNGTVWVHGNATKHIAEYANAMLSRGVHPNLVNIGTQQQIRGLHGAIQAATAGGVPYGRLVTIGGWELKFAAARATDEFPALIHALMR